MLNKAILCSKFCNNKGLRWHRLCVIVNLNRHAKCRVVLAMVPSLRFLPLLGIVRWLGCGFVATGANRKGFLNARGSQVGEIGRLLPKSIDTTGRRVLGELVEACGDRPRGWC